MMSTNSENLLSLIERKKLQWAKEKEELAKLNEPWSVPEEDFIHYDRDSEKIKRSSLPPLSRNQYNSYDKYVKEKEIGGETSGYGSDNPNQSPEYVQMWHQSGYESSSSRDDRLKWINKSVGVSNFCQSKEEPLKKTGMSEPPNWVKRGLKDGEILVNNTSPAESPEQRFEEDRPQTSSSYSQNRSNFIRGQNIPIDPIELSERERRRQAALAHQDAILQQLDERERRRQKEKERKIKEEFEEELRIEREREVERKRKEQEIKIFQERLEKERKRKEAIEEAIEQAQKEAQLAKVKKIQHNNYINNLQKTNKISNNTIIKLDQLNNVEINDKKTNDSLLNNDKPLVSTSECLNIDFTNNLEISPGTNKEITSNTISLSKSLNDSNLPNSFPCITTSGLPSNLAVVFPSTFENLQNMQYALLVPATPQNLPVDFSKTKSYCNSSTQTDESVFSQKSLFFENHEKCVREKLSHLDLCCIRKERRSRSESLEERPKWGVNRPPARYVKQSEKDLLYQRRKVRQKLTEIKAYDKHSSDESHNPSPRSYRKKGDTNKRYSRSNWRKEEIFRRDNSAHRTQLIQLQSDKDYIYYKRCHCCCLCRSDKHRYLEESIQLDVLKPDHNYRRNNTIYQTPSNSSEKLPDVESNDEMLVKLSKLHNDMAKLDDFLVKKKETAPILDLSKTTANSKEELRHLLEKVPDFKIKPEKVLPESIKIKEKKFMFKSSKYITKGKKLKSPFMDPIPAEMKNLKLEDLTSVPIDWRMLTNLRPKSKVEENYFSRMVELGKLQSKSRVQEKKQFQLESYVRKTKNKSGVVETRIISCTECEEDFCNGKTCCIYGYDSFARIPDMIKTSEKLVSSSAGAVPKRKIKTRSRSKSKLKKKYKEKSKSPKKKNNL